METINIRSSICDYSVEFIDDFSTLLQGHDFPIVYVIDRNVYDLYKPSFEGIDMEHVFFVDAIESKKNMDTVMDMLRFFQKISVRKNWKVFCFGGGITQDVTTMAACMYLRNIEWYFFPTTLLAMADSCIGGKASINFNGYKNQIGVFYPPKKIFIDTHFARTLTHGDYLNGWGEIFKFSLTADEKFYEEIRKETEFIPCPRIGHYIREGLYTKKVIIEEDEFENDLRRVLNFGHSFGHALEAYTKNAIPHGQGVLWGIDVANYLAFREGLIDESYYLEIKGMIKSHFLTSEIVIDNPGEMLRIVSTDKKVKDNTLCFAMLNGRSHLIIHPMELGEKLKGYFLDYLAQTHEFYISR